jgi:hypothetical protein
MRAVFKLLQVLQIHIQSSPYKAIALVLHYVFTELINSEMRNNGTLRTQHPRENLAPKQNFSVVYRNISRQDSSLSLFEAVCCVVQYKYNGYESLYTTLQLVFILHNTRLLKEKQTKRGYWFPYFTD